MTMQKPTFEIKHEKKVKEIGPTLMNLKND